MNLFKSALLTAVAVLFATLLIVTVTAKQRAVSDCQSQSTAYRSYATDPNEPCLKSRSDLIKRAQ